MPGNLNAAQPRPIPSFESMRIGDKPLPTSFALALRQSWTQMYDLRDYLLNLFVDDEVPNGPMNGQNKTFTLANSPIPPQSLELYRNGQFLVQGTDYNLIGKTITLAVAPVSTDTLIAFYRERLSVPNQPASQPIPPAPPTGGGGGSTGGLWTQNANFLYPTATFTECVLVGAQTSDFFGGPGQVGATAAIGMMTAAANASLIYLFISPGIETQLVSNKSGTGTQLPLSFYAGGFKAVVQTTGDFIVGARTTDAATGPNVYSVGGFFGVLSASTNSHALFFSVNGATETVIHSSFSGAGTPLPMSFYLNGVRRYTIDTNGALLGGIFSSDLSNGNGEIIVNTEVAVVTAATNASVIRMINTAGSTVNIQSTATGTGTTLSMAFIFGGAEAARFDVTSFAFFVGLTSTDIAPTSGMVLVKNAIWLVSNTTNASTFELHMGSLIELISSSSGTGTILPIRINFGGTEVMRITTVGQVLVGLASSDASNNLGNIYISNFFGILSATTNAHALFMSINGTTETVIHSSFSGTGTALPLSLYVNGTRMVTVTVVGALLVGALTSDAFNSQDEIASIGANSAVGAASAAANASFIYLFCGNASVVSINSGHSGTGTTLPITVQSFGVEQARWTTAGAYYVGVASSDFTNAAGVIVVGGNASSAFAVVSATVNATYFQMSMTAGTEVFFDTNHTGTGTNLPLSVYVGGGRRVTIDLNGAFLVGLFSSDASAVGRVVASGDFITVTANANASFLRMGVTAGTETFIQTDHTGTGTNQPLSFYAGGARQGGFTTTGQFMMGFFGAGDYNGSSGRIVAANDVIVATATTNSSFIRMIVTASTGELESGRTGTGTFLRMRFVTNATEQATIDTTGRFILGFASSDSGGAGSLMSSFTCGVISAAANAHAILMSVNGTTETVLHSTFSGTGTSLPLSLYVNGIRGMTLTVANPVHVLIGTITDDGTGALLQVHGNISVNGTVLTVP